MCDAAHYEWQNALWDCIVASDDPGDRYYRPHAENALPHRHVRQLVEPGAVEKRNLFDKVRRSAGIFPLCASG